MPKSKQAKLSLLSRYQIEQAQIQAHQLFAGELVLLQAAKDGTRGRIDKPGGITQRLPPLPKSPNTLRFKLAHYAQVLFNTEAPFYHARPAIARELQALKERVLEAIANQIAEIENRNQPYSLCYHDITYSEMRAAAEEGLLELIEPFLANRKKGADVPKAKRAASTVASLTAVRKLEDYIAANNIGMTEFATKAGTTDRTLRSFRRTGKIRRSLFEGIAKAMGITKEELLS
jgi:hypothetical protein